jgi:hypothetical protein
MGAGNSSTKAAWGMYTDFQEAVGKLFTAPMQLYVNSCYTITKEGGLGKSVKILRHYARGTIKLVK